jgi:hypothetical protein
MRAFFLLRQEHPGPTAVGHVAASKLELRFIMVVIRWRTVIE